MRRERRRASDVAGDVASPKLFAIFLIAAALAGVLMVKCSAEDYTEDFMSELVGDPELTLPVGYLETLDVGVNADCVPPLGAERPNQCPD